MNEHEKIIALRNKYNDIHDKAKAEKRALNEFERDLLAEIKAAINDLEAIAPQKPLTFNGISSKGNGGFSNFGDFLQSVHRAGVPNGTVDSRLLNAAGLNETVPSEGGFLVQEDFSQELLKATMETGQLAKLCMRVEISANSNGIKLNAFDETSRASTRFGGVLAYWLEEAGEKLATKPKFRQLDVSLKKLIGLCYASDELLQDASVLNTVIPKAFASEFGFMIDDAIVNGLGAGQPLGILQAGSLVSVAKESGQVKETILAENIFKMWSRLLPGSERTAVWLANKNTLPQLYQLSIAVGVGGSPIYMPANSIAGQPFQTLFGRPVIFCEQCAVLGTVGDIILADFANGYVLAEKGGIQNDVSIHVRFVYDESVFRFVYRCDGQPTLATALTPYKGGASNTQSHFVALATRA